ncbi:methyltransferase domain-containing protein [Galactobacter valiniphilus]|uniref:Methyltransferase domain-containing protein n=1 Tax=Galactobacter valiniphilus TaxID=2676122 RepID=A0A399JD88_9MICC|nr:methyltransferase [Galactobacter valiniphilus]RII42219.1 methyltransferase domain-containing protein [Galactobacter valiniphilus]
MVELPPLYDDLTFLSPLSEQRAAGLVAHLAEARPGTLLDIGCGWGEFLLRAAEAAPGSRGLGVDLEPQRLEEARRRAASRGLGERVSFEARDGREITGSFDAVVCIGASHVWGLPVEAAQPLDYAAALTALRGLVRPGGRLIYGEAVWSAAPTPAATAALSGRDDEYLQLDALTALASTHGFTVESVEEASREEWDAFEAGFVRRLERWLEGHQGDHPDADDVRTQLGEQRERYLNGYRGVLGLAYFTLVAD